MSLELVLSTHYIQKGRSSERQFLFVSVRMDRKLSPAGESYTAWCVLKQKRETKKENSTLVSISEVRQKHLLMWAQKGKLTKTARYRWRHGDPSAQHLSVAEGLKATESCWVCIGESRHKAADARSRSSPTASRAVEPSTVWSVPSEVCLLHWSKRTGVWAVLMELLSSPSAPLMFRPVAVAASMPLLEDGGSKCSCGIDTVTKAKEGVATICTYHGESFKNGLQIQCGRPKLPMKYPGTSSGAFSKSAQGFLTS